MTPKEKAIELYEHYWSVYYADLAEDFTIDYIDNISKKCALICVNEIIDSCRYFYIEFWKEVKQEIEKL